MAEQAAFRARASPLAPTSSQKSGGSGEPSPDGVRGRPRSRSDIGASTPAALTIDPRLLVWLSPAFPVGAFAYSHGLELAADRGWISDRNSLEAWLADLVEWGSLRNDLILLADAWRTATAANYAELAGLNELALALQPSAERHLETVTQGNAFVATITAAWQCDAFAESMRSVAGDVAYPIAVGMAAAAHTITLEAALQAYAIAFATNLVSAAIRLSLIGQTDGQRIIASLMPALETAAHDAATSTLDDLGSTTLRSDLASLAHETQYSRLFRS